MKPFAFASMVAALAVASVRADPGESAIVDAMKLAEAKNYSWTSDVQDDARSYTIDGRADLAINKDYSIVTMPMPGAMRRGPGSSRGGPSRGSGSTSPTANASSTAIFKGDEKFVLETPDGWKKSTAPAARSRKPMPSCSSSTPGKKTSRR